MIKLSPSISTSPQTKTLFLSVNLLNTSIAFEDLVVTLKNKNRSRSTVKVVLPPKLAGLESIAVIPGYLVKSILLSSPKDKKLLNSIHFTNHFLLAVLSSSWILDSTLLSNLTNLSQSIVTSCSFKNSFTSFFWYSLSMTFSVTSWGLLGAFIPVTLVRTLTLSELYFFLK